MTNMFRISLHCYAIRTQRAALGPFCWCVNNDIRSLGRALPCFALPCLRCSALFAVLACFVVFLHALVVLPLFVLPCSVLLWFVLLALLFSTCPLVLQLCFVCFSLFCLRWSVCFWLNHRCRFCRVSPYNFRRLLRSAMFGSPFIRYIWQNVAKAMSHQADPLRATSIEKPSTV